MSRRRRPPPPPLVSWFVFSRSMWFHYDIYKSSIVEFRSKKSVTLKPQSFGEGRLWNKRLSIQFLAEGINLDVEFRSWEVFHLIYSFGVCIPLLSTEIINSDRTCLPSGAMCVSSVLSRCQKVLGVLWKFQVLELGGKWFHSLKGRQMYFLPPSHIISVSASPLNVLA